MPAVRRVNVPGLERLPAFSHATIVGDQVFVSGTLGVASESGDLADGGTGAETTQALRNIETVLTSCGCSLADVAKVNVYLTDMSTFPAMNDAYIAVVGDDPPARITVGCNGLALGAAVEIDCIAFVPPTGDA
jgi:2-iminobutanoate/2-iminopropanoate deaminase